MSRLQKMSPLCSVLMLTCGSVFAQFNYSVSFSKGDLSFGKNQGYDVVTLKDSEKMDGVRVQDQELDYQAGNPSLPIKRLCLAIPANSRGYSVTVTTVITEPIEGNFSIIPQQPPVPTSDATSLDFTQPDAKTYTRDTFFPSKNAGLIQSGAYHGTSLAYISVCPIRYNPVQKKLELVTRIDFTVNLKSQIFTVKKRAEQTWSDDNIAFLNRIVDNPNDLTLFAYKPEIVDKSYFTKLGKAKATTTPSYYEYIVITSSSLAASFQPFVDWLKRKGIDAGVVTTSDIESAYDGDGMGIPESAGGSIRAYLRDAYENYNTQWALLGGDETVINTVYGVAYSASGDDYTQLLINFPTGWQQYIIPTDLYYSEFSGSWDVDEDGHYGELGDDGPPVIPDIHVGRIPCNANAEIQNWVEKTLRYDQYPGNGNGSYLEKAYSVAADQLVSQPANNTILFNSAGFTTHEYTVETHSRVNFDYVTTPQNGAQIITEMNRHYGICNWHCHGGVNRFAVRTTLYNSTPKCGVFTFDSGEVGDWQYVSDTGNGLDNMTNKDYYSVVYSLCCDIAAYDNDTVDSMAEGWLLASQKGGPILIGNTRYGWISESHDLQRDFYSELVAGNTQAGKASDNSKISQNYDEYLTYSSNLFGDPQQAIWTANPSVITPTITVNPSSVVINAGQDSCTIAVSTYNFGMQLIQENVSSATFNISVRPLFIVITKKNRLPYIAFTGGNLVESQTWGSGFLHLNVLENVTVPSGVTLTINPETTMNFAAGKYITVNGTLATGNGAIFTKIASGEKWGGLIINSGGTLNTSGSFSIMNVVNGIVVAGAASPTIQNVTISEFDSTGIQSTSSSPTLRNLSITGASTTNNFRRGIAILGGSPAIDSISVSNCYGGGIYVDGGASITSPIHDVTTSSPIIIKGTSSVPSIHDVTGSGTISIQGGSSVSSIYDVTTSGAISVTGSSSVPVIRDISLGKSLTVNSSTVDSIRNADLYGTEAALNLISAGSPFVQNVTIGGTLGSVPICISGDSPTLDGDSLSISYMEDVDYGVMITGNCEPMIRRSKIQVFGEGDDVGVYIGNYSSANICDSTEIYAYTCIYGCYDAWLVMNGERGYGNGYNAIVRAPDENDNYGYAIYGFLGSVQETFDLYYNYWGTSTPNSSLFYGPTIAYTPYLTTWDHSIPKIVSSENQSLSSLARQLEFAGEWSSAAAMYEKILNDGDADTAEKRGALLSLMRIGSRGGRDFSAIQKLISAELAKKTTSGTYLKHLEQLACEVNFRLGNTDKAINGFLSVAEKYTGTALEVDMLARIAEIYGGYLEDEATAKTYADKAAAINPGAVSLYSAYKSAGIDYYPWKQDNVFATQDSTQDEPEEQAESAEEYVSISPNPANPVTTIAYSIANKGTVKLSVYAMNGQKVATLVNGPVSAGKHSVQFDGSNLASGIYFYRFESAGMKKTGKMMILK